MLNQGAWFRASETRVQGLYWCPGLNAGIPLIPKPKDPSHEKTFENHDFTHFNMPDLVFDGKDSKLHKLVYIAYRLMSECITLVMADMIFVNGMVKKGFTYSTVNQRKIYPLFQEMEKKNPNFEDNLEPFIHEILKGSFEYCFYGDTSRWISMMETDVSSQFTDKYDAYFLEDFRWTLHNYKDMASNQEVYA